jgi:hypothetical protein
MGPAPIPHWEDIRSSYKRYIYIYTIQVKGGNNTYPSSLHTINEKGTYLLTPSDVQVSQCLLPIIKFRGYTSPQKARGKAMPWLDERPPQFSFWFGVGLGIP